jgi:hypothetical protein
MTNMEFHMRRDLVGVGLLALGVGIVAADRMNWPSTMPPGVGFAGWLLILAGILSFSYVRRGNRLVR